MPYPETHCFALCRHLPNITHSSTPDPQDFFLGPTSQPWLALHCYCEVSDLTDTLLTSPSPICLSSLLSNPYITDPEPAHLAGQRGPSPVRSDGSDSFGASCSRRDSGILVLSRCHHAFHLACLTSWFEYRRYRCPICQESYSPAKAAQR